MRAIALAAGAAVLLASNALAQTSDDEWLRRCDRDGQDDRENFCEIRESGFRPGRGVISVEPGTNGGVSIVGWERDSVSVHARIRASAPDFDDARALARDVEISRRGNTISTDGPDTGRRENWSVQFVVYVPRNSDLSIETLNGPLSVRDVNGRMDLHTQNGPLSISAVGGDVRARAVNGPLTVNLTGRRWDGEGLDAETSNGPVNLRIPEDYSARLETGTVNGPFQSDIPLTVTFRGRLNRHLNVTLGQGGPAIRVVTTNGPVSISRG